MKPLKFFLLLVLILLSPSLTYADDNGVIPINLDPERPIPPTRPKSPSIQQLSCYLEDETIVVSARQHETADVVISDTVTGQIVVQRFVALCPEACIDLTGISGPLTIDITVASGTYSGSFIK